MDGFFNRPPPDIPTLLKFNDISPAVQSHLASVYRLLSLGILLAAGGAALTVQFPALGGMSVLFGIGAIVVAMYLYSTRTNDFTIRRSAMLAIFSLLKGLSLGGLVGAMLDEPQLIVTAFLGTFLIFASFSGVALFSKRRSMLYIGGLLSSVLSWLFFGSLFNMFFRSQTFFSVELVLGLLVFAGYTIFDTQMIVERASGGERDAVTHAIDLFIDFIALFVRLAIILMRNSEKKKNKK